MNGNSTVEPDEEKKPYDEEIAAAAENYMTRWSNNSYMHTEYDLKEATILDPDLTDEEISSAVAEVLHSPNRDYAISVDIPENERDTADALKKNMQFMIDKAEYFSEMRRQSERTDFELNYHFTNVDAAGNVAVVNMVENISFQYPEEKEPSFGQEEHTVSLVKVDSEWIVVNVDTMYDWFASDYKNTNYDIEAIIAENIGN